MCCVFTSVSTFCVYMLLLPHISFALSCMLFICFFVFVFNWTLVCLNRYWRRILIGKMCSGHRRVFELQEKNTHLLRFIFYLWISKQVVRLNLFNHVLVLFLAKFACNLAIRYPVFRWELCKGSV